MSIAEQQLQVGLLKDVTKHAPRAEKKMLHTSDVCEVLDEQAESSLRLNKT